MADLIRKLVTCDVKEVADRTLQFIGSTETQDRDGEVIKASGWDLKNYKKNPIFMWAHRYTDPPIGKAKRVWVDRETSELKFNIEFAPPETYEFADTIYKLYKGGFLRATSVGFFPDKDGIIEGDGEKSPKRTYTKQELLELSGVPVPSNPEALVSARDAGVITTKEFETLSEKEVVNKPEETETHIRIPVRDCKVTATIDISKKEGIQALYCGKIKKVRTYIFDKRPPYNWTMAKAKKWVEDHKDSKQEIYQCECIECGYKVESEKHCRDIKCPECGGEMRRVERPGPGKEGIEIEERGAIPYKRTPLAPEGTEWDAGREVREAEVSDLKTMCAIVEGDPDLKTSYKLPHHKAGGEHACVWRAVANCAAVLMGARGGVQAPAASIAGAKAHIAKHYKDFDKGDPPWEKAATQSEVKDEVDYLKGLIEDVGLNEDAMKEAWELVREIMRLAGSDIPDDIRDKIGATITAEQELKVRDAIDYLEAYLAGANVAEEEPEEPETEPELDEARIGEIVAKAVGEAIGRAQGKI